VRTLLTDVALDLCRRSVSATRATAAVRTHPRRPQVPAKDALVELAARVQSYEAAEEAVSGSDPR
jgi:hypothetical protein